jgi:hypothetical protein
LLISKSRNFDSVIKTIIIAAMKKVTVLLMFQAVMIISLQAQKVSDFTYQLDNGINVRMEHCWNQVWVDQRTDAAIAGQPPLSVSLRTLGDLTSGSSFKLESSGKEVPLKSAKTGTYVLKLKFKLSGKPGTLSFDVDNIVIKAGSKTTVSVTLYDYQVSIMESPGAQKGFSFFDSKIERYKGNAETNATCGVPAFYAKGQHEKPITPDESITGKSGRIKPGTYDVMITLGTPGKAQKVWLENFIMKPDVSYKITTNLNAGAIIYSGTNKDVKTIHLYPAGTAARQTGNPAPDKNLEIMKCETQTATATCAPGSYDVLLNIGNGKKYEWRKNVIVTTGSRTGVK